MQYYKNVWAWLVGFTRLGELQYLGYWNAILFLPIYAVNYGSRVLMGGACVSWSRWLYEHRTSHWSAKFLTRLLNFFDTNHGAEAGGALWGTKDCPPTQRIALWSILGLVLIGIYRVNVGY